MRHQHHLPPPLPQPLKIKRAVDQLHAQIKAKHADTLGDRISGMSTPAELEYSEPESDLWTPLSWAQTFGLAVIGFLLTGAVCLAGGVIWELWGHGLIELIKAAPWPRLG